MLTAKYTGCRRLSLLLTGVLLFVAWIISLSHEYAPPGQYNADKFIHAGFYCLLTLFCLFAVANSGRAKHLAAAMAIFLYGLLLELLQYYIDSRTASIADIGANAAGIISAILIKIALSMHSIADDWYNR